MITKEEEQFIQDNSIHFQTIEVGYIKKIDRKVLDGFHAIYTKYIDASYVLTAWCDGCVFNMIAKIKTWYESLKAAEVSSEVVNKKKSK